MRDIHFRVSETLKQVQNDSLSVSLTLFFVPPSPELSSGFTASVFGLHSMKLKSQDLAL